MSSITSDDADKGSITADAGTDKILLDNWTFGADAVSLNEIWVANYQGIARTNQALNILPDLTIDDALKNRLEGEARFLRAYFYWNLVRSFGGVPLVDYVPDPSNEEDVSQGRTRASAEEIYNLIISDLQFGIENLPSKTEQNSDDLGRATSGAAKTFLAKVYLYRQNWEQVKTLTDEIIASGDYALADDYATIWREAGKNSDESIFEVQAKGISPEAGIQQYTEVQGVRDQFGWGFNTPSEHLPAAFDEEGDKVRKNATIIFPGEVMWDGIKINEARPGFPPMYSEKNYVDGKHDLFPIPANQILLSGGQLKQNPGW